MLSKSLIFVILSLLAALAALPAMAAEMNKIPLKTPAVQTVPAPSAVTAIKPLAPAGAANTPSAAPPASIRPITPVVPPATGLSPATASPNAMQPQMPGTITDPTLVLNTLRAQNRRLKDTVNNLRQLQAQSIKDGQLICSDDATSSNMQGITRDCAPYACDAASGTCKTQAASSYDCASGFYWENGRCVRPPPPPPGGDCGIFCL